MANAWKCSGCHAKNDGATRYCENCGCARPEERPEPAAAPAKPTCATCREETPGRELAPGRDGLERCGPCHIKHLRATMANPDDPEIVACKARLRELLATMANKYEAVKW